MSHTERIVVRDGDIIKLTIVRDALIKHTLAKIKIAKALADPPFYGSGKAVAKSELLCPVKTIECRGVVASRFVYIAKSEQRFSMLVANATTIIQPAKTIGQEELLFT